MEIAGKTNCMFACDLALLSAWVLIILYAIFKLIIEKPWGALARHRQALIKNNVKRKKQLDELRTKMNAVELQVIMRREKILELNFFDLKEALQTDRLLAADVLDAYVWKAISVQDQINCVIEFVHDAFNIASCLDEKWHGVSGKPPLFGIPFSIKGNFHVKGYDCTVGLAKFLFQPKNKNCSLVDYLVSQGAVPFVITNVPQALLSFVCSNVVYGTTSNPHSYSRTPGGSSGGESALLAANGTVFGTGSDLAGSLRIPASMCGLVTLKPTEERLIVKQVENAVPGKNRLALSYGFFTKTVSEQKFLLENIFGSSKYHELIPKNPTLPLDIKKMSNAQKRKLRIGYILDDGFMKPIPSCARVVTETVAKLKNCGHKLMHFYIPQPDLAASLFYKSIMPDGGRNTRRLFANEDVSVYLVEFAWLLKVPNFIRKVVGHILRRYSKQLSIIANSFVDDLDSLRDLHLRTDEYVDKFISLWRELELDALLCPSFPVPAIPHVYGTRVLSCAFSSGLYNMLNFPAGIVPTGEVTEVDDALLNNENHWPTNGNIALKTLRKAAQDSAGLPLAVQVVSLPFEEEICLTVMQEIENVWK